jgi:hypothetical protein
LDTVPNSKLMLIGLGDLGSIVLELLARIQTPIEVVVGSRNPELAESRCRLLRLGALAQGCNPAVRVVHMNLQEIEATAETIYREKPAIIFSTATMSTWWLPDLLQPEQAQLVRGAGFGVWLPVHLAPTLDLMRSVRMSGHTGFTITAPYPDVVNCMLGKVGLAPTCGIGNVAEMATKVQQLAADALQVSTEDVQVSLVAHHALERYVFRERVTSPGEELPPFLLKVTCGGKEITSELDSCSLLFSPFALTKGPATHFLTAGATVRLISVLQSEASARLHVPAPSGLAGGYPVCVDRSGISLDLGTISRDAAVAVNERSHSFDGIEEICPDGTAVIGEGGSAMLCGLIGYAPDRVTISDVHEQASELVARFRAYASDQGVRMR